MQRLPLALFCFFLVCDSVVPTTDAQISSSPARMSDPGSRFVVDVPGVIGRSEIVLGKPNLEPAGAMPLGNGRLGVAVWSADGLTAQLNRNDTLPGRLSPGQIVIPGLTALTRAKDYAGRLDLYRGEFREQGGGMTATTYVEPETDALIVTVTGADPTQAQTALLKLWAPRSPKAAAEGRVGRLTESWIDDKNPGSSGRAFGSLSAITAEGRDVVAVVTDPLTITVSFRPDPNGHFRVRVAAPHFDGKGNEAEIADRTLAVQPDAAHASWWADFWKRAAIIKITSQDGAGEYMENLRNIYLYVAVVEKGVEYPGSQAGIADMISSAGDEHRWDSSAFWHWNLRMQVAANIGAGLPELNEPYFNLYRGNLASIEQWTKEHMKGLPGVCVPETMRFNGPGIEYESTWKPIAVGNNCDAGFKPYYNARTISTGAEISLWMWRQYLTTNDRAFLEKNYPLMAASARFLLAYQKPGTDGLLHTSPSNAHETQWDVADPTTDVSAVRALYPATIEAAQLLGKDADLVRQLRQALDKLPRLPRTRLSDAKTLLAASADGKDTDVIAESYQPGAEDHNIENIGLEPVWPYGLIGDTSPLLAIAKRTYAHRPNVSAVDWSFDPIQAARLGLGSEVATTLITTTEKFQGFPNGMCRWEPSSKEFYVEQVGVVADALQEALVQDYDGVIRIAPAIPPGWDFDGSVFVRGRTKVDVQTRSGVVTVVVIEAGASGPQKLRNPWPRKAVNVISVNTGKPILKGRAGPLIEFAGTAGESYRVTPEGDVPAKISQVTGTATAKAKRLGPVQIGLFAEGK